MGSLMPGWDSGNFDSLRTGYEPPVQQYGQQHTSYSKGGTEGSYRSSLNRMKSAPADAFSGRKLSDHGAADPLHRRSLDTVGVEMIEEEEADGGPRKYSWWRHLESAAFNRPADEKPSDWKEGSFVPQHDVAGHSGLPKLAGSKQVEDFGVPLL